MVSTRFFGVTKISNSISLKVLVYVPVFCLPFLLALPDLGIFCIFVVVCVVHLFAPRVFQEDGTCSLEYSLKPLDRGHCAPPSGGAWVSASGLWTFQAPGIKVDLTEGFHGHFSRMIPTRAGSPWDA